MLGRLAERVKHKEAFKVVMDESRVRKPASKCSRWHAVKADESVCVHLFIMDKH